MERGQEEKSQSRGGAYDVLRWNGQEVNKQKVNGKSRGEAENEKRTVNL